MFPDSLVTREQLHQPINNFATVLRADVNATQTTIPIAVKQLGSAVLPPAGMVSIDKEVIYYGAINPVGPQLINCVRGFDGTATAPHSTGARVEVRWVAAHHNTIAELAFAMQMALGAQMLDASRQMGVVAAFADLSTKLRLTLPEVRRITPATKTWTIQHDRKRLVSVQLYELDPLTSTYHIFQAPVSQTIDAAGPGFSTVTIEPFDIAREGAVVIQ